MAVEHGSLYFMFLGPPSPKFLDPLLTYHTPYVRGKKVEKMSDLRFGEGVNCRPEFLGDRLLERKLTTRTET